MIRRLGADRRLRNAVTEFDCVDRMLEFAKEAANRGGLNSNPAK
jgi:hypothetical protein